MCRSSAAAVANAKDVGDVIGFRRRQGDEEAFRFLRKRESRIVSDELDRADGMRKVGQAAAEDVDAQRAAGGIVRGLAHVGVTRGETALVVDAGEIVRQALVV